MINVQNVIILGAGNRMTYLIAIHSDCGFLTGKRKKSVLKGNIVHFCQECGQPCFFSAVISQNIFPEYH